MTSDTLMRQIDALFAHVWMVRTFLKHSEEAKQDESLQDVHRTLYDVMLALGKSWQQGDNEAYLRQARKKYSKLKAACNRFVKIQPEISTHTNFQMAAQSLTASVDEIGRLLEEYDDS